MYHKHTIFMPHSTRPDWLAVLSPGHMINYVKGNIQNRCACVCTFGVLLNIISLYFKHIFISQSCAYVTSYQVYKRQENDYVKTLSYISHESHDVLCPSSLLTTDVLKLP